MLAMCPRLRSDRDAKAAGSRPASEAPKHPGSRMGPRAVERSERGAAGQGHAQERRAVEKSNV